MKNLRSFGVLLFVLGVGSFILPMIGMQFRLISIFGPGSEPVVGGIAAVIGLVLIGVSVMGGRGAPSTTSQATGSQGQPK